MSQPQMLKKQASRFFQSRTLFISVVMVPTLVWFFIFMFYPIFLTFQKSFTNAHMAYNKSEYIGFENYRRLFADEIFLITLKNTVISVIYTVVPTLIFALIAALLLNSFTKKIRETFTLIYFLPVITSMVAISIVWTWLYNPSFGILNYLLDLLGLPPQSFIYSAKQALASISAIQVWKQIGFFAVIFVASLRTIPITFYEAAVIDGANRWNTFRYVTLPMLKPTLLFVIIIATIDAFKIFVPAQVITQGGPGNSTMVLVLYMIQQGIVNMEIGYASAVALVMFAIVLTITMIQWWTIRMRD